jgi:hypothetical protein
MELALNLAWIALASLMFCLWLRFAPRIGPDRHIADRRAQFVALAVLILILFPVISVTDDLQAIQNPAETDSCLRRNQIVVNAHSIVPAVAALPVPIFGKLSFVILHIPAPGNLPAPVINHPALASIQNRPPPAV